MSSSSFSGDFVEADSFLENDGLSNAAFENTNQHNFSATGANNKTQNQPIYLNANENVDVFLEDIYTYFLHGGLGAFLLAKTTDIFKLVFVALLIYAATFCVHFDSALVERLQQEHLMFADFWHCKPVPWWSYPLLLAFIVYALSITWASAKQVHRMWSVHDFYRYELKIERVHSVRWCDISAALLKNGELQRANIGKTQLDIAARLTRKDNFVTAIVSSKVLDIPIADQNRFVCTGWWTFGLFTRSALASEKPDRVSQVQPNVTQALEWALDRTLFALAYDRSSNTLAEELTERYRDNSVEWKSLVLTLQARMRSLAVITVVFAPFVLATLFVNFLLENGDQWRANRSQRTLTNRYWSPRARWLLRHYNELPHQCRRRLARAHNDTSLFLDNFAQPKVAVVARFAGFCFGSIIAVLLTYGFWYDDDMLTNVNVAFGRSAIWWIGVLSALMTAARSLVPDDNVLFEPRKHLRRAAKFTHFMPRFWLGNEQKSSVRKHMAQMCEYRWTLWLREVLAVLTLPYLLWVVLPKRAEPLLIFLRDHNSTTEHIGNVCRFAEFSLADEAQRMEIYAMSSGPIASIDLLFSLQQHGKPILSYLEFCKNNLQHLEENEKDRLCRLLKQEIVRSRQRVQVDTQEPLECAIETLQANLLFKNICIDESQNV